MSIALLAGAAHVSTLVFAYGCSQIVTLFDTSPILVNAGALFRWDAFHFDHIARVGYEYEHEWAFFRGLPIVLRVIGPWHAIALLPVSIYSATTLYKLSLSTLGTPTLARLTTLLSLLPSSPVTLRLAPYAEAWYTCFSYRGMLACSTDQWTLAAFCFALAACFRSNGITLAGFLVWGMLFQSQKLSVMRTCHAALLVALVFAPFAYHNYSAYSAFCTSSSPQPWCNNPIPSIYTHVQSHYWNVGLFNYWSLHQLPNFIIAAPPLVLLFAFTLWYFSNFLAPPPTNNPFLSNALFPHVIHALFTATTLLLASHTQIALRLLAALPTIYWAAAWLFVHHTRCAKAWLYWSALWASLSVVLWVAFLPPA